MPQDENYPLPSGEAVKKKLEEVIRDRFKTVRAFADACERIDPETKYYNKIQTYLNRASMPGLDAAVVMAEAAGMSVYELAGIEKPPSQAGTGVAQELIDMGSGAGKPLVQTREVPESSIRPGYAFGSPGRYQLVIDFIVTGPDDREIIPFGQKDTNIDEPP